MLKEAELLGAVADQQVFGLLIVVQHHGVRLASDARLLVAAEGSVRGIGMVAVDPHAACLNAAAQVVAAIGVAAAGSPGRARRIPDRQCSTRRPEPYRTSPSPSSPPHSLPPAVRI